MTNTSISDQDARDQYGVRAVHEVMPNGERRFRLVDRNGFGYIRSEASAQGAWQRSHVHHTITETYIVQTGWIAVAELAGDDVRIAILREGDLWTAPMGRAHNVYMAPGAVTHVVKHGNGSAADWVTTAESALLDEKTTGLSAKDVERMAVVRPA